VTGNTAVLSPLLSTVVLVRNSRLYGGRWKTSISASRPASQAQSRPKTYVRRRTAEGKSKREIIRCLKRFVAREIYGYLCPASGAANPMQITA
jgi:hypothetical protein